MMYKGNSTGFYRFIVVVSEKQEEEEMRKKALLICSLFVFAMLSGCGKNDSGSTGDSSRMNTTTAAEEKSKVTQEVSETETTSSTTEEQVVPDFSDRMIPRAESFDGGDGSETNPFRISTKEQLALLSYRYSEELHDQDYSEYGSYGGQYYLLTEDIYLNDTSDYASWGDQAPDYIWIPIGYFNEKIYFDGGGHTIYGMYVDMEYKVKGRIDVGLFGSLHKSVIKNVNIKQGYIRQGKNGDQGNIFVGGLAGEINESEIENCTVDVSFMVNHAYDIGGICGNSFSSDILNCVFEGEFKLTQDGHLYSYVGGIAGSFGVSGTVENCENHGSFSYINDDEDLFASPYVGGIVCNIIPGLVTDNETAYEVDIRNCVNEMDMDLGNGQGAGIASSIDISCDNASVVIDSCKNKGNIVSSSNNYGAGGLIYSVRCGYERNGNHSILIRNCSNHGNITSVIYAGGIVSKISAEYSGYEIVDCNNTGNITSTRQDKYSMSAAGGIIGFTDVSKKEQTICGCVNEGTISCISGYAGGIIGVYQGFSSHLSTDSAGCTVKECENNGLIQNENNVNGTGGILGGVISAAPYISIENCINRGKIGGHNETCAGGIVGSSDSVYASSEDGGIRISKCVNYGTLFVGTSTKLLTEGGELKKRGQYSDVDDSYKNRKEYYSVNTGSSLGGLIGCTRGALVEDSVNAGAFEADDDYMVLDTAEAYLFHAEVNRLHPDEIKGLFVGGIAGGKHKGAGSNTGTLLVRGCFYADTCNRGVIDDEDYDNETMYDAERLSKKEAEVKAKKVQEE